MPERPVDVLQGGDGPLSGGSSWGADSLQVTFVREGLAEGIEYLEVVYGSEDPNARLPMVVALHGRADRPRLPQESYYGLRQARVILPQAPDRLEDGFTWLSVSVLENKPSELADSIARQSLRVARALKQIVDERPTVGLPVVAGFSQGGILSFALALRHPEIVGVALPLAGVLPSSLVPEAPIPGLRYPKIIALHGSSDPIIPLEPTQIMVDRLHTAGFDVELRTFQGIEHTMSLGMNVAFSELLAEATARSEK